MTDSPHSQAEQGTQPAPIDPRENTGSKGASTAIGIITAVALGLAIIIAVSQWIW